MSDAEEEISLSSSGEAEAPSAAGAAAPSIISEGNSSHWEARESIEITLTAQPEDTLTVTGPPEVISALSSPVPTSLTSLL